MSMEKIYGIVTDDFNRTDSDEKVTVNYSRIYSVMENLQKEANSIGGIQFSQDTVTADVVSFFNLELEY